MLAAALEGAAGGQPCAVVIHGEAGIGKTRLVRVACETLSPAPEVLWGTCVHFGDASVPFAPVAGALRAWLARADAATRAEVLFGAGELASVLPGLGEARQGELGRLLPLIDLVVGRLAARRPTVVVVDDLQWADRTSLDVLAYLITGFREQRLALLATCRDEHRTEGHPLHAWLADMRRMPGFEEVHLDRLDLAATETQIEGLVGRAVDIGLAAQVQERSGGNPYLTELLVRGLSGTESELPEAAPAVLRDALLAGWHGLSAEARLVSRLLAVGGRPLPFEVVACVADERGVFEPLLTRCLTEAVDAGVVRPDEAGRPWFRHPLLAEVLYDATPPGEGTRLHATYVRVLNSLPESAAGPLAADLAVHNHRAGRVNDAYRWSLLAADRAAQLHATTEEAIHLKRACCVWAEVSPDIRGSSAKRVELLRRASRSCERAGWNDSAAALIEQALALTDRERDPLLTSTLLLAWCDATHEQSVRGKTVVVELLDAVRLTEPFPDRPERALALAALAFAERWDMLYDDAATHADQAVWSARRSGSERALAAALSTRASVHVQNLAANLLADPLADAREAERIARSCGAAEWLENAGIWHVNCLINQGRTAEATEVASQVFEEVRADGSRWAYFLASQAADGLLALGRWNDCRNVLRPALAARCKGMPGASVRLTAARLAARCGRVAEAEQHLARARELISADYVGLYGAVTITGAEVLLAAGKPQQALDWFHNRLVLPPSGRPNFAEDMLIYFANAAAETAQTARDANDERRASRAIAMLDDVLSRWPSEPFTSPRPDVADQAMAKAVFDAEVARCRNSAGQADLWRLAVDKCGAAGWPWEAAVSRLRCAEAMLADGSPSSAASDLLRQAHATAVELGAQALQDRIQVLTRIARITLRQPAPLPDTPQAPAALAGLTTREREILAFLVAGRSNAEIANELFISDKTVSVHVSNILRKTGTSSRVEAAALAERLAGGRAH
jgi:DNA-binding CsgD family transcriptional regulator